MIVDFDSSNFMTQTTSLVLGIVSGKDLTAADSNGLSDPFVVIVDENGDQSGKKNQKTKIIMKTLNPTWNETFQLSYTGVSPEQLVYKLELFDYDRLSKNDPIGYVNLNMKKYIQGRNFFVGEENRYEIPVIDGEGTITITIKPENFGEVRKPPVFGVSLRELLDRNDIKTSNQPVPDVVRHCCQALMRATLRHQKGLKEEGIFRLSGNQEKIKAFQQLYDNDRIEEFADKNEVDNPCDIMHPHDCAGLLKLFLRDLSEPLLGFEAYKPVFKAIRDGKKEDEIVMIIKRTISSRLTPHEIVLVNVILYLLYQTILYADTNKMGATNMAVVFGQIFLCEPISVNESDQSNLNAAIKEVEMRNKACELMITNYYKLFTGKEGSLQRVYYPYLQEQNVGIIEDNSDPIETLNALYEEQQEPVEAVTAQVEQIQVA